MPPRKTGIRKTPAELALAPRQTTGNKAVPAISGQPGTQTSLRATGAEQTASGKGSELGSGSEVGTELQLLLHAITDSSWISHPADETVQPIGDVAQAGTVADQTEAVRQVEYLKAELLGTLSH